MPRHLSTVGRAIATITLLISPSACSGGLLANGGFEQGVGSYSFAFPTTFGVWGGDDRTITGAENGITPADGAQMLRFDTTGTPPLRFFSSDVWQLVDLSGISSLVGSSQGIANFSAAFNRVHVDSQSDNRFVVDLFALAGSPATFPDQVNLRQELAHARSIVDTDRDPATWERVTVSLRVPDVTDFLAVRVLALENIFNDPVSPEFDGHYADTVALSISAIPEPSSMLLWNVSVVLLLPHRRTRR